MHDAPFLIPELNVTDLDHSVATRSKIGWLVVPLLICQLSACTGSGTTWGGLKWGMDARQVAAEVPGAHSYVISSPYERPLQLFGIDRLNERGCPSTVDFFFDHRNGLRAVGINAVTSSPSEVARCVAVWTADLTRRYGAPAQSCHLHPGLVVTSALMEVWRSGAVDVSLNQATIGSNQFVDLTYHRRGFYSLTQCPQPTP